MDKIEPGTFAEIIHSYLASPEFNALAESTQYGYRHYLKVAELPGALGDLPIGVIRPALVQRFLDSLSDRPGAQYRARGALKAVEGWALIRDLLPYPITTKTKIIHSEGGHKPWTEAQVALAEAHAAPHVARIVTLASNTGQRGSDLIRMRWCDISEEGGRQGISITTEKVGLQLWIPFSHEFAATLATWERRFDRAPILLKKDGKPYAKRQQLSETWLRERDSNPELTECRGLVLHGLRATAIVRLRRAGATTPQIVDMVGLSAQMVERYSRHASQKQSALAAIIHLDRAYINKKKDTA